MPESQLEWIPVYIDRLLGSPRWRAMSDFQRGWYWQLLIESVRSERPGYLKLASNLWTIAGAKRKDFFESHKSIVLACFKVREMDGSSWIYNERLVRTLEEQAEKVNKKRRRNDALPSYSMSDFSVENKNNEGEVCPGVPDLPAPALARGMCEELEMAATLGNLRSISAAIEAIAKRPNYTLQMAYKEIKWKAIEAKSNGEMITKFWFEDSRWKDGKSAGIDSKATQRLKRSFAAGAAVFGGHVAKDADTGTGGIREGVDDGGMEIMEGDSGEGN